MDTFDQFSGIYTKGSSDFDVVLIAAELFSVLLTLDSYVRFHSISSLIFKICSLAESPLVNLALVDSIEENLLLETTFSISEFNDTRSEEFASLHRLL
ncbi:hypothetical protein CDL12_04259 [Handroanthus impetiginosus]|uniref:Uncharacterized protein n=1 Tax=Handroanthus impetiginosus TaxID=429701 RepID=A0A2G9HZU4_9LAMI|nr:hypothetical protein CDL12_04259 [Handroanthus impetiginosus]